MQAILTRYVSPTDTRGARIKATCDSGSVTVPYDHSATDPFWVAATTLIEQVGWDEYGAWIGGVLPSGRGRVYVCRQD